METYLLILALIITGLLLFISIYFIITLSDLECDYLNPQECCCKLNSCIKPRIIIQLVLDIIFALSKSWIILALNAVFTIWLLYESLSVPKGSLGVYDPTEIYNKGQIKKNMRVCIIICGYYLANFFFTMYATILSVLRGGPPMTTEEPHAFNAAEMDYLH